jgi:hypothetical protein
MPNSRRMLVVCSELRETFCITLYRMSRKYGTIGENENGMYSQNEFSVSNTMIDTQMQARYPVSSHMANGVRRYGVNTSR